MNTGCTSDVQVSAKHNTQIPGPAIYTENPDSHLTQHHPTTPDPCPSPLPTPHLHHRNQNTDTCPTLPLSPQDWKSPNPILSSTHPPSPPTPPRAKHIHMSHTPPTPLTSTSPVLDKTPEPRVPRIHALTATTPHPDPTPALPSPSHPHSTHTCNTSTVHASQSLQQPHAQHRVLRQPHKQTKDYHRTTNTTQTHRPSSKSERNLIILQVNINRTQKQTRGAQTAYSRHTCRHHHNSGNQAHP